MLFSIHILALSDVGVNDFLGSFPDSVKMFIFQFPDSAALPLPVFMAHKSVKSGFVCHAALPLPVCMAHKSVKSGFVCHAALSLPVFVAHKSVKSGFVCHVGDVSYSHRGT